jgi:hypothetical protein
LSHDSIFFAGSPATWCQQGAEHADAERVVVEALIAIDDLVDVAPRDPAEAHRRARRRRQRHARLRRVTRGQEQRDDQRGTAARSQVR